MIHKTPTLLALTAAALVGSAQAAIIYSFEAFEGGTPNYEVQGSGPYSLVQLQDAVPANITSEVALIGTDYTRQSNSRSGIFANGNLPGTIVNEPTGQHAFVSNSLNRSLTLTNPMSLVTDGATTLHITFDTMVYAFDDGDVATSSSFDHIASVFYSASGEFTDSVELQTYSTAAVADPATALIGHTTVVEDTWQSVSVSVSSSDVTFTDTAKVRFNKLAPVLSTQMVFYDNIEVSADTVPEPSSTALFGLAGLALLLRRRK